MKQKKLKTMTPKKGFIKRQLIMDPCLIDLRIISVAQEEICEAFELRAVKHNAKIISNKIKAFSRSCCGQKTGRRFY